MSPIILFVYNRVRHTRRAIESLLANAEAAQSVLYIFADGARGDADRPQVEAVRLYCRSVSGFAEVRLRERERNMGLAANVIGGVTEVVERHGQVIVLEDDLVVTPHFLRFMNDALTLYADEPRVGHIQACDYTNDAALPPTFLIQWMGCWGWATWARAWRLFRADAAGLLDELERRGLTRRFDFDGTYPYTRMLRRQVRGEINSWAIRWNASLFLAGVLSLQVGRTLVSSEGFDGSGTHCGGQQLYHFHPLRGPLAVEPISPVEENVAARRAYQRYYHRHFCFWAKAMRRLGRMLHGDFK